MDPLYSDTFQATLDPFYSKQEELKISKAMNTLSYHISDKKHKILINYLANRLKLLRENLI